MLGGSIGPLLRLPRWTHFYVIAADESFCNGPR
jgi:hypothetical protein